MTFHCCRPTAAQRSDTGYRSAGLGELPASFLVGPWLDPSICLLPSRSEWLIEVPSAWWRRTLGVLGEVQPYTSQTRPLISTWWMTWTDRYLQSLPRSEAMTVSSWVPMRDGMAVLV